MILSIYKLSLNYIFFYEIETFESSLNIEKVLNFRKCELSIIIAYKPTTSLVWFQNIARNERLFQHIRTILPKVSITHRVRGTREEVCATFREDSTRDTVSRYLFLFTRRLFFRKTKEEHARSKPSPKASKALNSATEIVKALTAASRSLEICRASRQFPPQRSWHMLQEMEEISIFLIARLNPFTPDFVFLKIYNSMG